MDGSHSPFGVLWQVASSTGWSLRYILWRVNYQTLVMMAADQPRYIDAETVKKRTNKQPGKGKRNALAYFQSRLQQ